MKKLFYIIALLFFTSNLLAQTAAPDTFILLKPDHIFDGQQIHVGGWVLVKDNHIEAVGEPGILNHCYWPIWRLSKAIRQKISKL